MADLNKILLNNTFTFPGGFNIDSTEPIDSRFQVDTKEDLYKDWGNAKVTNKDGVNETIYKYDGLITYVKSEGKSYRYNSSLLSDENLKGWELVPVLSDIPNAPVQGISVDGVEIEPDENGIVNITLPEIPEVVHPEYTLEAGDANSVKLLKDGESTSEVSISLTTETRSAALLKATKENVGKIILVSGEPEDSEYLNGTYIIDGIGSVKYLATTTGSSVEANTEELIDNAIKELDSTISAEKGKFLTSITIEDGKLVGSTSDVITIPEAPEYTIQGEHPEGATKTTYKLFKGTEEVPGSIIEVNDSEITFKEGDIYIADKHVLITSDLDDYKVKNVALDDKILSVDINGNLSSTISIEHGKASKVVNDETIEYPVINLIGKDGKTIISYMDATEFVKDGFLSGADYNAQDHILTLTWNTDAGIETTVIELEGLVDVHDVVGGDNEEDLVKIEVSEKNENDVLTFTVSIDETNLQNKLDELDGKFIKSVVDNDTATYVKVNADTTDQVVTISVDESELSNKFDELDGKFIKSVVDNDTATYVKVNADTTDQVVTISVDESELSSKFENIEDRLDNIENNEVTKDENSSESFVKLEVNTDENKDVTIAIDDSGLKDKIDSIESNFSNYVESVTTAEEQSTLLKVEVDNTDKQNPVISLTDNGLDKRITDLEGRVDNDTKCKSATINVADAPAASEDEVDVIAKQTIILTGETGESLETEQPITSVKVVTKQYVDGKFTEVPTYTAITNDEIDALFV